MIFERIFAHVWAANLIFPAMIAALAKLTQRSLSKDIRVFCLVG